MIMTSPIVTLLVLLSLVLTADLKRSRSRSGRGEKDFSDVIKADSSGLFICDLSMHDFSRDLLLASSQQSNELKASLLCLILRSIKYMHTQLVKD